MSLPEDERARYRIAHHERRRRLPNSVIALLFLAVAIFGPYLAFRDHIPLTSRGYQLGATFSTASNVTKGTPVRISGVDVGEVIELERTGNATTLRFTLSDEGRPVSEDATVKLRPRMFFEGNYFLDLEPGSPSAPELANGETIPLGQTTVAVQLDEILTSLQEPNRRDLGDLLDGWGTALTIRPRPADDRTFGPAVKGKNAAEALNLAFETGGRAGRGSAIVGEAFRGTEPRDLRRMIAASARTFDAFAARRGELQELITNWSTFVGALAAESENLAATFAELAPTLETTERSFVSLNRALPPLRTWARLFRPAVAELPAMIAAADPWLREATPLVSRAEAGGLARLLRRSTPGLAEAARSGLNTLTQIRLLSRCTSEVLVPTGDQVMGGPFSIGEPNYKEFFYASTNIAGESQNMTGSGSFLRLQPTGGETLINAPNPMGTPGGGIQGRDDLTLWGRTPSPTLGTQPQLGGRPPKRPDVRCHTNEPPDLNAGLGQPGPPMPSVRGTP